MTHLRASVVNVGVICLFKGFDFTNDQAVYQWYQQRTSKHLLMRQPANPMDLVKVVQYDPTQVS